MNINVYLYSAEYEHFCECARCGNMHKAKTEDQYFTDSLTSDLIHMAECAGLYLPLWNPMGLYSVTTAKDLIPFLKAGLGALLVDPKYFKKMEDSTSVGTYNKLVDFVKRYLKACQEYPNAFIIVNK